MNETQLIQELLDGSEHAYRALYRIYSGKVYNTCLSMVRNRQDAEDITQDVFVEVFRSLAGFRKETSLSTWIYRITISKTSDHIKRGRAGKRFAFIRSLWGADNELLHDHPYFEHPGVVLERREDAKALFHALARLPLNQQTAFTLRRIEGLSQQETAAVMQCSEGAVESLLVRAGKKLRELLTQYYNSS